MSSALQLVLNFVLVVITAKEWNLLQNGLRRVRSGHKGDEGWIAGQSQNLGLIYIRQVGKFVMSPEDKNNNVRVCDGTKILVRVGWGIINQIFRLQVQTSDFIWKLWYAINRIFSFLKPITNFPEICEKLKIIVCVKSSKFSKTASRNLLRWSSISVYNKKRQNLRTISIVKIT